MDKVNFNKFKSSNPNLPDGKIPVDGGSENTIWNYGADKNQLDKANLNYAIFNNVQNYALANGYEFVYEDKDKDRKQYFGTELHNAFISSKVDIRNDGKIDEEEFKRFLEFQANKSKTQKSDLKNEIKAVDSFTVVKKTRNFIDNSTSGTATSQDAGGANVSVYYVKINDGTKKQLKEVFKSKNIQIPDDDYSTYVLLNLLNAKYAKIDGKVTEISDEEVNTFIEKIKAGKSDCKQRQGVTDALYSLANGKTINLSITDPETNVDLISNQATIAGKKLDDAINKDAQEDINFLQGQIEESKDKVKNNNKKMSDFENSCLKGTKDEFRQKFVAYIEAKSSDDVKKKSALRKEVISLIKEKRQDEFKFYEDAAKDNTKVDAKLTNTLDELEQLKKAIEEDKIIISEKKAIVDEIVKNNGVSDFQQLKFLYDEPLKLNRINPKTKENASVDYSVNDKTKIELYKKLIYTCSSSGSMKISDSLATKKLNALLGYYLSFEKVGVVKKEGKLYDKYDFIPKKDKSLILSGINLKKEDFEFGVKLEGNKLSSIETEADKIESLKLNLDYYKN